MYVADIGVKCPECGIKFNTRQLPVLIDTGRRNSELRQDFKGVIPQFEQYAIGTCPACGLADWINAFPQTSEMAVLNQPSTTPHLQYKAAALGAERGGKDSFSVGQFYLHAAWCADDNRADVQAKEYRRMAVDAWKRSLIDASCPVDRRSEIEYLIGELLRRAGDFDGCRAHFKLVLPRLAGRFALMARKLMRLAENGDANAVDFAPEEG